MASKNDGKKYDLVVFGATGFTGKLCCKYLAAHLQKPTWAMAGRSASRLASTRSALSLADSVGVIEAQTDDYASLVRMTGQARVLVNIVGPFRPFKAEEVVRACIETDTHYVDLSGETGFNADVIEKFHRQAEAKQLVIAPSVGFDSLPFDLTTYLAVQEAKKLANGANVELAECAYDLPPALSAGTLASAISMADEPEQMLPKRGDWLSPVSAPDSLSFKAAHYFPQRRRWGAQTAFTYHNTRMVMRTWGLLKHHASPAFFGDSFKYTEGFILPNRIVATIVAYTGFVSTWLLMNFALVRWIMSKSMKQNSGPSEKLQHSARLRVETVATAAGPDRKQAICSLTAQGDGGYLLTSRMIVETALTILEPNSQLTPLGNKGGVLTPAALGADKLAQRLRDYAQFSIETSEFDPEAKKRK
ncbi:hypothetical protein BCV70DRAFT_103587 [Testicularia cyperi]|uniref:Saccharopine dehydrogenase NADP binding domain-containing protein n=1 Tax=Testicularia cyperi TaxID=1882483 RepID=A0A317XNZ0_9BASI|nr:hypothetical protein BCV70DRAFT_103587 [Testicularia cyperi]